jgi:hypothetical protein
MPNWKKLITSGSDASLRSLFVTNAVTASIFSGSFTGSLFGTASWANNVVSASFASTASNVLGGAATYIPLWNSATTLSSSVMYQSSSNIGIGTTSPQVRFSVQGSQNNTITPANAVSKFVGGDAGVFIGNLAGTPNYGAWLQAMRESDGLAFPLHLQPNGGNVGIGTTSPGATLDISSSLTIARIRGGGATNQGAAFYVAKSDGSSTLTAFGDPSAIVGGTPNSSSMIWTGASIPLTFHIGGDERMRITAAGNVGIGTTSPSFALDVKGANSILRVESTTAYTDLALKNTSTTSYIQADTTNIKFFVNGGGTGDIVMALDGTNKRVGIGTTSPSANLHVATPTSSSTSLILDHGSSLNRTWIGFDAIGNYIETNGSDSGRRKLRLQSDNGSSVYTQLFIDGANQYIYTSTNASVGIGTSPSYKLHVVGDNVSAVASQPGISGYFLQFVDGRALIRVENNNTNPSAGATGTALSLVAFSDSSNNPSASRHEAQILLGAKTSGQDGALRVIAPRDLNFYTNAQNVVMTGSAFTSYGSFAMTINSSGNVGVGATSPNIAGASKGLSIDGSSTSILETNIAAARAGFLYSDGASSILGEFRNLPLLFRTNDTEKMRITATGNVGIGVSPSYKLDVAGVINSTAFNVGNYISYGFTIGAPSTDNFGNARNYIRLHAADSTVRLISFKIRISTTYNWAPGMGYIDADVSYYYDGANLNLATVNVTSATGQALYSISIGDLVIESGYVSIPIYIINNNTLYVKVEGSPNFDYSLITTSTWSSFTFPGSNTVRVPGALYVGSNAGIPNARLDVTASAQTVLRAAGTNGYILIDNVGSGNHYYAASKAHYFQDNSNNVRMFISASGNVGIGTVDPNHMLDILTNKTGNSAGSTVRLNRPDNSSYENAINWATNGVSKWFLGSDNNGTDNFYLYNWARSNYEITVLSSSGNVGINTTSPTATLTVSKAASNFMFDLENADETAFKLRTYNSGSGVDINVFTQGLFYDNQENASVKFWRGGSSTGGFLTFTTNNGAERVRITANGNIGIGTTSDSYKLSVAGDVQLGTGLNRPVVYDTNAGNFKITANAGGWSTGYLFNGSSGTYRGGFGGYGDANNLTYYWIGPDYNVPTMVITSGSTALGGYVGIGTATPSTALDVNGTTVSSLYGGNRSSPQYAQFDARMSISDPTYGNNYAYFGLHRAGAVSWQLGMISSSFVIARGGGASQFTLWTDRPFAIDGSNNVGIGTITPSTRLHVAGSTQSTAASGIPSLGYANSSSVALFTNADVNYGTLFGTLSDGKGWIQQQRVDTGTDVYSLLLQPNGGNVGIGTTSPGYKLEVNGTLGVTGTTTLTGDLNLSYGYPRINLTDTGNNPDYSIINDDGNFSIYDATNNTHRIYINSSGNVGIGTTSPQKRLDALSETNDFVSVGSNTISSGSWTGIHFGYRENNTNYRKSAIVFERTDLTSTDAQGKVHILNGPQGSAGSATLSDAKITIAENGNVGIGTRSPQAKLHIPSSNGSSDTLFQKWDYAGNPGVYELTLKQTVTSGVVRYNFSMINAYTSYNDVLVLDRGNVGIGLTDPLARLHISASNSAYIRGGDDHEFWDINVANTAGLYGVQNSAVGALKLGSGGPTLYGAGSYLGIGTISPSASLQINNSISNTGTQTVRIATTVGGANTVVDALHIDGAGSGFNQGIAISIGYKDSTYGTYASRIVNYTDTGNTQATKLQLQTQAVGGTTWNAGILIDTVGNVGINQTSPSYKLHVEGQTFINNGTSNALYIDTTVADSNTRDAIYLFENESAASGRQAISWYNGNESYYKARLWTQVGGGYNATQFGIDVANNARTVATRLYILNGDTYHSGDVIAYASDLRLKENIKPIENALDKIQKISGVHYQWKDKVTELGFEPTNKQDIGVIAQEIQAVLPEAVKPAPFDYNGGLSKSGENYLTVQYEKIVPLLIEAIKELKAEIDILKTNK